ncbi:hypothetical protein GOP47_0002091 [Adiantum capillus-veneris]|uniref:UBA domain-containing protein n=1 Tax=Adiantum capillus-veneris TaxID=13818 RepID=A0A9D4V9Y5_ADICA|nr:hypothetical protein GOP47_0002091 [Adiantum capillus-veneris]
MAAALSMTCGICQAQLRSVEDAQEHAELTGHTDFAESIEPVLNLVCRTCGKPCRTKTECDLHTKRTGHEMFDDKTNETAKPISLTAKAEDGTSEVQGMSSASEDVELVDPEVNKQMLQELEDMGFPQARAVRALYFSGSSSVEAAINWVVEHENDPDIDEIPQVPATQDILQHNYTPEEAKAKMLELRERARKKKEEEEKRMEKEREKERIRIGKELLEAKRIEEENERKRLILLRKAEKEEEQRARDKIRQKLEEDKAERRRKLGLPPEETPKVQSSPPTVEVKKSFLPVRPASKAEQMRECLRGLKQNHKDEDARVKKAFQTLLTYVGNIARSPDEEKFRKIRISNPTFQERVGSLKGGIQFLEICGFQKDSDDFLILPRDKVDVSVLSSAGSELNSAIVNPYFGVL